MRNLNSLFDWMDLHNGNPPSKNSIDPVESQHAQTINDIVLAKAGQSNETFHPEYLTQAMERGYPDIFNTTEDEALRDIQAIFDWMDTDPKPICPDLPKRYRHRYIFDPNYREALLDIQTIFDWMNNNRQNQQLENHLERQYALRLDILHQAMNGEPGLG